MTTTPTTTVAMIDGALQVACHGASRRARPSVAIRLDGDGGAVATWVLLSNATDDAQQLVATATLSLSTATSHRIKKKDDGVAATLSCSTTTFLAIARKELAPSRAVLTGKVKLRGARRALEAWKDVLDAAKAAVRAALAAPRKPTKTTITTLPLVALRPFRITARHGRAMWGAPTGRATWRWRLRVDRKRVDEARSAAPTDVGVKKLCDVVAAALQITHVSAASSSCSDDSSEQPALSSSSSSEKTYTKDAAPLGVAPRPPPGAAFDAFALSVAWAAGIFVFEARSRRPTSTAYGTPARKTDPVLATSADFALDANASLGDRLAARDLVFAAVRELWR